MSEFGEKVGEGPKPCAGGIPNNGEPNAAPWKAWKAGVSATARSPTPRWGACLSSFTTFSSVENSSSILLKSTAAPVPYDWSTRSRNHNTTAWWVLAAFLRPAFRYVKSCVSSTNPSGFNLHRRKASSTSRLTRCIRQSHLALRGFVNNSVAVLCTGTVLLWANGLMWLESEAAGHEPLSSLLPLLQTNKSTEGRRQRQTQPSRAMHDRPVSFTQAVCDSGKHTECNPTQSVLVLGSIPRTIVDVAHDPHSIPSWKPSPVLVEAAWMNDMRSMMV